MQSQMISAHALIGQTQFMTQWVSPSPTWPTQTQNTMKRPSVLVFHDDAFMDTLIQTALQKPQDLDQHRVKTAGQKLFQPVHGDFALVAASLVCSGVTLPERQTHPEKGEQVAFVVRRLVSNTEYAWVKGQGWVVADLQKPNEQEDLQGLFPVVCGTGDQQRRIWAGLVPTSSRDTFVSQALRPAGSDLAAETQQYANTLEGAPKYPATQQFKEQLQQALLNFREKQPSPADLEASAFFFFDFLDWFSRYLPSALTLIDKGTVPADNDKLKPLYQLLVSLKTSGGPTFWDALKQVRVQHKAGNFDPTNHTNLNLRTNNTVSSEASGSALFAFFNAVPPKVDYAPLSLPDVPVRDSRLNSKDSFVVRMYYHRPYCRFRPHLLSEPSLPFTIAPYFDPDAPARPIHITMPSDVSIRGLRKYRRNVSIEMSSDLRKKIQQVTPKVMEGKLEQAVEFNLGLICSFSIPIITLVALILLLVFVVVLNIVFWWLPFFRLCFPIKR
ncbi:hypothetical protein [Deinococcus cellulosilyticus]|uniref:Uncharacterized protein n=1 Tax=Deinococcus cellulosilyticus (strain DSM 18568 / NBRC 106333 / KACC 11606 / 5516J-15) TaxID=1223518 RepID=A0A511N0N6_DEIC1|nr:hypothetical protein [Deinococcus cellulosilyticus]GEM46017.1 hypothetical protein DC3_16520 [Deinococcus cellulosilyticus NBRC 106333 = KACC 11606]